MWKKKRTRFLLKCVNFDNYILFNIKNFMTKWDFQHL